jgi:antitoxin YefM
MKTLSLSEAKMKLSSLVDAVQSTDEEVVITRNGSPAAVIVSPEEFESLKETVAVRSDEHLMRDIRKGLRELRRKKARLYTLEELFD